jgi:lipid A biosynthesis acyltransferase
VYMDGQTGVGGPGGGQHHSVVIPMVGMEMRLRVGPAYLAQKAQAPVVLAVAHRTPGGRRMIEFSDVLDPPAGDDHQARVDLMHRMAAWFEERVRRYPEQWGGWFVPVLTWAETGSAPAVSRVAFDRELERVRALVADAKGSARLTADRARVAIFEHQGEQVIVEATAKRILGTTPLGCGVLRAAFRGVRLNRLPRMFPDSADALGLEVARMVLAGLARIEGDARA